MQHKAGDGTMPTLPSAEVSAVPCGPAPGGAAFRRCAFSFAGRQGKGRPDMFGVLQQACYVITGSNQKC